MNFPPLPLQLAASTALRFLAPPNRVHSYFSKQAHFTRSCSACSCCSPPPWCARDHVIRPQFFFQSCRVPRCGCTTAPGSLECWWSWAGFRVTRICPWSTYAFFTVQSWDWNCWFTGCAHFHAKSLSKVTVTPFTATSSQAVQPPACTGITSEFSGIKFQFFDVWVLNDRITSNSPPQLLSAGGFFGCCFLKFNSDFMPSVSPRALKMEPAGRWWQGTLGSPRHSGNFFSTKWVWVRVVQGTSQLLKRGGEPTPQHSGKGSPHKNSEAPVTSEHITLAQSNFSK